MADFTYKADKTLEENIRHNTLISQYENSVEQRRSKWANPLRSWRLVFRNRTLAELNNIKDFFISKKGAFSSFTWENPNDSTEYTVRFDADSFKFTKKTYQIFNFEFSFIEVK